MATVDARMPDVEREDVKAEWLARLVELFATLEQWAIEAGWTNRAFVKSMRDVDIGTYEAPALLLDRNSLEVIVEPLARIVSGAHGVVSLCLLPSYDDVAVFFFRDGSWRFSLTNSNLKTVSSMQFGEATVLSRDNFHRLLGGIGENAP